VKKLFFQLLAVALLTSLAGCGFHLRGSIDLPPEWRSLQLVSASPNSELNRAMESAFERNGIQFRDPDSAGYHLYLGLETFQRRNLTIGNDARAAEFELNMSTTLRVTDRAGVEIMPETEVNAHKVMTADPENITGKVEESLLLRQEMRQDLVQQLMRQLRFLATGPGTTASRPS
jgi:LPS-assembly lipoprotein